MSHFSTIPAVLLLSLPPSILVGIDLLTFTTSPQFLGIKNLPPGWHFLYTSETTSFSIRDGFWFHIPAPSPSPNLIVRKWDPTSSSLIPCSSDEEAQASEGLEGIWKERLTPYRQSAGGEEKGDWAALTRHITPALLSRLTGSETDWRITTASCGAQDADHIPGLSAAETGLEERELRFLGIDLKRTWRVGAVGRERTEAVLDRSWALGEVEKRFEFEGDEGGDVVMGEIEVCFLMVLTVANYSCLEEWKRVLVLVLTCRRALRAREGWFAEILGLLRRQLERGDDVEGGLFDMGDEGGAYMKGLLKGFKMILGQVFGQGEGEDIKEELGELEVFLKTEYGWELSDAFVRKGMLELEDGEQIEMELEDMEGEDERGEYAPVVVEL
ncbi:MAG: hypothetical protein Q9195_008704 [Heterodermia aff. obscurata]